MTKQELEEKIKYYQNLYYSGANAEISDSEFDELWDQLVNEYPDSELLMKVGDSSNTGENKFKHTIHMGSQAKTKTYEELQDWIRLKNIVFPVVIQTKNDGISAELCYQDGKLVQALTRGDGIYGKDITENVKLMDVPKSIPYNHGTVFIRGEIMLPIANISKLTGFDEIKNPRNIASGIANQKDSKDNLELLTIVFYDVHSNADETSKIQFLKNNGFKIPEISSIAYNYHDMIHYIEKIKEYRDAGKFSYQIDGAVIKQNTRPKNADLTKARPDWQRAFKYENDEYVTNLIGVEWSRNGFNFTPVALLDPVEIDGTTVSRASLANFGEIKRLGVGIPCEVAITKRNEIIPKVEKVIALADGYEDANPPEFCPICGAKLSISDTLVQCVNPVCPTRGEHRISKWFDVTGALGFGDALVNYLTYDCHIEHISELYCNDVIAKAIEGYPAPKNVQKAFADLWAKSFNLELYNFLAGFDLGGLGAKVIKLVTDAGFDTFESISQVNYDDLKGISGFAETRVKTFVDQMKIMKTEMEAVLNTKRVTIKQPIKKEKGENEMTFCITGKLSSPRKVYEEMITTKGHKFADSVSKNTTYLVNNDINSTSSKNVNAKKLGIPIINEEEFLRIING